MTASVARALVDTDAERAVLGAILLHNPAFDDVADVLEPEHFGTQPHRDIFEALRALHLRGEEMDLVTLRHELQKAGTLDRAGGVVYVSGLIDGVPKFTNVVAYAAIVRDRHARRRLREVAAQVVARIDTGQDDTPELLTTHEQAIYGLKNDAVRGDWISGRDLATELHPLIDRMIEERSSVNGVPSGFTDLDRMTRGFQRSDLILLGARPSQGKTAFGIAAASHAAEVTNVAVFTIEMSRESMGLREVIYHADVDGWKLLSGRLSEVELHRVGAGLMKLADLNIWMDESPELNPLQVRSKLRRLRSKVGHVGLVVIDYLQLMAALPEHRRENKVNQVAGISRALKIIARELGVPFLVLSQLHRVPENRRPTMADLRDSGALEQDADVVLLLHRPEVYDAKPENAGLAELIVAKHRNGPTGIVELTWRAEPMRFENRSYR